MAGTGGMLVAGGADAPDAFLGAAVPALALSDAAAALSASWAGLLLWLQQSYAHAPALMLGLSALLAVPVIALIGALLRWRASASETTVALWRRRQQTADRSTGALGDGLTWPVDAWIEVDGKAAARFPVGRELLRIGRDGDNELVLDQPSVHRFHAAIQRTEDAEIVLVDLSGDEGNGVTLNGKRVSRGRLQGGDEIGIGAARLKFGSRRA